MPKTISAHAMRDRLLARLQVPRAADDWMRVLAVPGHRELFGLIVRHNPPSIGALAELAGRAQPNVSRALSALVLAGLVEVVPNGRLSIPRITEAGAARARDLDLAEPVGESAATDASSVSLFSVETVDPADEQAPADSIPGGVTTWLWLTSARERVAARADCDLDALGRRLLENWWRLLCRRDAPFRLWEFALEEAPGANYSLACTVFGAKLSFLAHTAGGRFLDLAQGSRVLPVTQLEQHLLDELLRPLAAHHWLKGRSARPLHALLRRVEDSREQPAERAFCRTAGALGLSPYDLAEEQAQQISALLDLLPDEDARLDFGSAVPAESLGEAQLWTSSQLEQFRHRNAVPGILQLREACASDRNAKARPFRHGYALARIARERLGLADDTTIGGVEGLSRLLGAGGSLELSPEAPGALRAFQSFEGEAPTFIVEDEGPRSSAFTLARGVGDFLGFGKHASCVADLYTDRQAVGRAFAAEFMAPRSAVVHMIEEEDEPISRIADHFGTSPSVIHRQYENAFN